MCGSVRYRDAEATLPATCHAVSSELHRASIPVITQPLYSPDLALSDFCLFPTLKMKGMRIATMEDTNSNATAKLRKIPKEAFCWSFQQWQDRWSKCVCVRACMCVCAHAQGSYFEGDEVSVVVCPTITVLYHISGNFMTAPHMRVALNWCIELQERLWILNRHLKWP